MKHNVLYISPKFRVNLTPDYVTNWLLRPLLNQLFSMHFKLKMQNLTNYTSVTQASHLFQLSST